MKIGFIRHFSNQIINFEKKTCVNCHLFIDFQPKDYDKEDSIFGSCNRFPEKNLVTGVIYIPKASECRYDEKKCGIDAKYFIPNSKIHNKTL